MYPEDRRKVDPMFYYQGTDAGFYSLSIDEAKKLYISKKGQGKLTSEDKTVTITPNYVPYHLGVYFTAYSTNNFNEWQDDMRYRRAIRNQVNSTRKGEFLKYNPKDKLPNLKFSPAFYDRDWEVDYLPMFKTVGDPNTEEGEIKLFSGIVAYRNKPYKDVQWE